MALTRVPAVRPGDLESDDEDLLLSRQELAHKLTRSNKKIDLLQGQLSNAEKSIHQFEYAVNVQHLDMELLRKQIYQNQAMPAAVPQPIVVQVQQHTVPAQVIEQKPAPIIAQPAVTVRAQRKNSSPPQPAVAVPEPVITAAAAVPEVLPQKAPKPVVSPVKPTVIVAAPVPVEPVEPALPTEEPPVQVPVGTSSIVFPPEFNGDIMQRSPGALVLTVADDITLDELVFELRSAAAEMVCSS
jgi:hypothetical protein